MEMRDKHHRRVLCHKRFSLTTRETANCNLRTYIRSSDRSDREKKNKTKRDKTTHRNEHKEQKKKRGGNTNYLR